MKNNKRQSLTVPLSLLLAIVGISLVVGGCQQGTGSTGLTTTEKQQLNAKAGPMPAEARAAMAKANAGPPTGKEQSPWSTAQSKPQ